MQTKDEDNPFHLQKLFMVWSWNLTVRDEKRIY